MVRISGSLSGNGRRTNTQRTELKGITDPEDDLRSFGGTNRHHGKMCWSSSVKSISRSVGRSDIPLLPCVGGKFVLLSSRTHPAGHIPPVPHDRTAAGIGQWLVREKTAAEWNEYCRGKKVGLTIHFK
ncbi:hypothetical protein AVEN_49155-1 [Araneus ventricosus]|uniref:Uncharacterized protein n=1 Tax=Araneus ventricosus TaxID=182803 RepID=A0A4Y2C0I7_ARAVE|nr:hypothetical protein AVEN_49155-1 [Araneus ventricosus]